MKRTMTIGAALAALALPATAAAHVTIEPAEMPAGGYGYGEFSVGHGCDGSPTTELRIQVPPEVKYAVPEVEPGWGISTKKGAKGEGTEVVWTADEPLADDQLTRFGMVMQAPKTPGEELVLPAVQKCEKGENPWIEVAEEGEKEPDFPAPVLTVTEAEEDDHGAAARSHDDAEASSAETEASAAEEGDSDGNALAIAGLIFGGLGMLTGGAALRSARR